MNFTELARQVHIPTKDLRLMLPEMGFDIGGRAIKVDNKVAQEVIRILSSKAQREKYISFVKQVREAEEPTGKKNKRSSAVKKAKDAQQEAAAPEAEAPTPEDEIKIPSQVVVKDLAGLLKVDVTKLVVELMRQGVMASLNDKIDFETASIVAEDFGFKAHLNIDQTDTDVIQESIAEVIGEESDSFEPRPPVVVVMGHVDHGKTRLLDAIRQTNIVDEESGGITQHIGAYQVEVVIEKQKNNKSKKQETEKQKITFIDTPGHEAFSLMRSRGARVADLAILVVAADDGVQPQTIEAVSHIKKAELPFLVAINKIDKDAANIDNVKSGLAEIGITPEDWSGDVMMVPISAKEGLHIQDLLESLLLLYEVNKENIKADPQGIIAGTIIESHIDKGSGPVATVLVKNGTLEQGQSVLVGDIPGKIRSMKDWQGYELKKAPPSTPVAILGLKSVPPVGYILKEVDSQELKKTSREHKKKTSALSLRNRFISESDGEKFNLIIKADVLGSLEALQESLSKLNSQDIALNIVSQGLGYITETDILNAEASQAYVLGFNAYPTPEAQELARTKGITTKSFEIIYDYLDFVAQEASKKLSPEVIRHELGRFKLIKIFRQEKDFVIAGGKVLTGEILDKSKVDIYRGKQKLGTGQIDELQAGKEPVNQVVEGQEAGLKLIGLADIAAGDELVIFQEEEKIRTISL